MITKYLVAALVGTIGLACADTVSAQDPRLASTVGDKYVISAKAGGVNYISGRVSIFRKDGSSGYLVSGDELEIGDRVTTSADAMAEILLNPGSYLRLGGSSSFEFITTDLEDLKVRLRNGSAVFEVIAADDFRVSVSTPQSDLELTRSGVFRLDVLADGSSRLSVFKGTAFLGPNESTEVEDGRTAMIARNGISVSKFDRDNGDALDVWSKARSKELAKVNAKLKRDPLRNTLLSSFNNRWNMYGSFGLWVFDPFFRMWTFLPFGYGWDSPYGWGYGFDIWRCRLPQWVYYAPPPMPSASAGTVRSNTPKPQTSRYGTVRHQTPPYIKMERNERSTGGIVVPRRREVDVDTSTPSFPAPSAAPVIVPSTTRGDSKKP